MCSGSEAGSYLRLIDFAYPSTLGLRVIKKKKKKRRKRPRCVFRKFITRGLRNTFVKLLVLVQIIKHRLLYHSTLGLRLIKKRRRNNKTRVTPTKWFEFFFNVPQVL